MQKLLESMPGLPGRLARYINSRLSSDQPGIAIAASLSFCSALMAKRVCYQGFEPSLYTMIVADPGKGKTRCQGIIADLAREAGLADTFLCGVPASDAGLYKALTIEGRRLLCWDEMGIALSALSKSQNSCEAQILSAVMALYSSIGKPVKGKLYSQRDTQDVEAPYLSIFGASTPNRFWQSMSKEFLLDGFQARWITIFQTPETEFKTPFERSLERQELIRAIELLDEWILPPSTGNLRSAIPKAMARAKLPATFEPDGKGFDPTEVFKMVAESAIRTGEKSASTKLDSILWGRGHEQYVKMCLQFAELRDRQAVIPLEASKWCFGFMDQTITATIAECKKNVFTNQLERVHSELVNRIENLILPGQTLSKTAVTERTYKIAPLRVRKEIIESLLESGAWTTSWCQVEGSRKKTLFYTRTLPQ